MLEFMRKLWDGMKSVVGTCLRGIWKAVQFVGKWTIVVPVKAVWSAGVYVGEQSVNAVYTAYHWVRGLFTKKKEVTLEVKVDCPPFPEEVGVIVSEVCDELMTVDEKIKLIDRQEATKVGVRNMEAALSKATAEENVIF